MCACSFDKQPSPSCWPWGKTVLQGGARQARPWSPLCVFLCCHTHSRTCVCMCHFVCLEVPVSLQIVSLRVRFRDLVPKAQLSKASSWMSVDQVGYCFPFANRTVIDILTLNPENSQGEWKLGNYLGIISFSSGILSLDSTFTIDYPSLVHLEFISIEI